MKTKNKVTDYICLGNQIEIVSECNGHETITTIQIEDLEAWAEREDWLSGSCENVSSGHDGEPIHEKISWDYTVEEILNGETNLDVTQMLSEYLDHYFKNHL